MQSRKLQYDEIAKKIKFVLFIQLVSQLMFSITIIYVLIYIETASVKYV